MSNEILLVLNAVIVLFGVLSANIFAYVRTKDSLKRGEIGDFLAGEIPKKVDEASQTIRAQMRQLELEWSSSFEKLKGIANRIERRGALVREKEERMEQERYGEQSEEPEMIPADQVKVKPTAGAAPGGRSQQQQRDEILKNWQGRR